MGWWGIVLVCEDLCFGSAWAAEGERSVVDMFIEISAGTD